jgi:hypothetical protein
MVAEVFGTAFLIPAAQCEFEMGSTEKGLLNAIGCIGERNICKCHGHMIKRAVYNVVITRSFMICTLRQV